MAVSYAKVYYELGVGNANAVEMAKSMGPLRVLYSAIWRQEQPLPPVDEGLTYDRVASFRFTCARSDLT